MKAMFRVSNHNFVASIALLGLRLVAGSAFILHGMGKMQNPFSWMGAEAKVPAFLQFLAAFSEFGGGAAWILGLLTPLASLGIACTMAVAVFVHAVVMGDPFVAMGKSYELALLYFSISACLIFVGPGKFALDRVIFGSRSGK